MAWNPSPEVAVARDAAKALGNVPMTMLFYVTDDGQLRMATYGRTKPLCAEASKLGKEIWDWLYRDEAAVK